MSDFGDATATAAAAPAAAAPSSSRSRDGHSTARAGRSAAQSSALSDDDSDSAGPFPSGGAAGSAQSPLDFVEWGPPPDLAQRELIFDSLNKIVAAQPQKSAGGKGQGGQGQQQAQKGDSRGTYVFTVGAGYHGQLGRKFIRGQKKYSAIPMLVELGVVVRQVSCGGLHTAVVTEEGRVLTWGDGRRGELGHVHDPSLKQTPRPVEMLDHVFVTAVACGGSHTVALTDTGALYSFGFAKHGQLGHGERSNSKFPKRIEHPLVRDIAAVACGSKHTVAVTRQGLAIAFGANRHGQCCLGDFEDRLEPEAVRSLAATPIASVACGAIHTVLVAAAGELYIAGFGEHFVPDSDAQHFFCEPRRIDLPEPVRSVAAGQAHNLALTQDGNVYSWGSGEYGQLGSGVSGNSAVPRMVLDTRNIRQVAAGRYHSFALTDCGILYSWGCGENGQLGLNSDENVLLPTVVTPVLGAVTGQVSCGEHHTAILTSAPWTKLSADVHEWLHAAKVEHELREIYLKKTRRGLTSKDLAKLAVEKERWRVANEARKRDLDAEEKAYMAAEVDSVQFDTQLQQEVRAAFAKAERERADKAAGAAPSLQSQSQSHHTTSIKKLSLPVVAGASAADADDEEEKREGAGGSATTRLPNLSKKKSGAATERSHHQHSGGAQAMAQTAPLDGSATVRVDRSYDATARAPLSPSSGSQHVGASRTQFLRESAGMLKRMTHVVHDKGEAQSARELAEAVAHVFALRKEYDSLVSDGRRLAKRAADMRREADLIDLASSGGGAAGADQSQSLARVSKLQMQLNTVTIKIGETSDNKRNYELNIAHLMEEELERSNALKSLRKHTTDTALYVKKMEELRLAAHAERAKSEAELAAFRQEVAVYQQFVTEQLAQFESILEIVRAQNDKREQARRERDAKLSVAVAQRVSQLTSESQDAEKESDALSQRLQSLQLKLRHFEDSFQKISAATGLNHPDAITNKFFFKGEIRQQLQSEIDEKQHALDALRREEAALQAALEAKRLSHRDQTWRDVEQLSESAREVATRTSKANAEIERVTQRLAFVQEGLLGVLGRAQQAEQMSVHASGNGNGGNARLLLADPTGSVDESKQSSGGGSGLSGLWSTAQSGAVFASLESAVDSLLSSLSREHEQRQLLEQSNQQRTAAAHQQGAGDRGSGAADKQSKLFGFNNMRHLRMLSQQSQTNEQQQQQQNSADDDADATASVSSAGL